MAKTKKPPPPNRGARLLAARVRSAGTLRAVAILAGENEGQLANYLRGIKPSISVRLRLEHSLQIPFFAWDQQLRSKETYGKNQK